MFETSVKVRHGAHCSARDVAMVNKTTAGLLFLETHDTFETTVGKLLERRIQIYPDYFWLGITLKVILNNFQNNA